MTLSEIAIHVAKAPQKGRRKLVAITGAPASGKSTLAEDLQPHVPNSCVVPMDGFHMDNEVLDARGLAARKGAPNTFEVDGFVALIAALGQNDRVTYPLFDRGADRAIPDAASVGPEIETVLVEGNYLLLNHGGWEVLPAYWDLSVYLDVDLAELERRLLDRWTSLNLTPEVVHAKTYGNDLKNARAVAEDSFRADLRV